VLFNSIDENSLQDSVEVFRGIENAGIVTHEINGSTFGASPTFNLDEMTP
jgi:hypothetical protein